MSITAGKRFEQNFYDSAIKQGYCVDRLSDRMSGYKGDCNFCDFILFNGEILYYIECKSTQADKFRFNMLSENQYNGLCFKYHQNQVCPGVLIQLREYNKIFFVGIDKIKKAKHEGKTSLTLDDLLLQGQELPCEIKKVNYTMDLKPVFGG